MPHKTSGESPALPHQREYTPTEQLALANAQKNLLHLRHNDRQLRMQLAESHLAFQQELRANVQSSLFAAPQNPLESPADFPEAKPTPVDCNDPSQLAKAGVAPLHPSIEAAIGSTLKKIDSPEWLTQHLLPGAEERLIRVLLEKARSRAVNQGRTRRINTIRSDRVRRDLAVLKVLAWGAYAFLEAQGQKVRAKYFTSATYFTVLDVLPVVTGYGTTACEEAVADLRACGLIATRRVYQEATFRRKAVTAGQPETEYTMQAVTGVWLTVLLQPERSYLRAMVLGSELPEEAPRDLLADRKAGRTAYQLRQEGQEAKEKGGESFPRSIGTTHINNIILWSLPPTPLVKGVKKDSPPFLGGHWNSLDEIRSAVIAAQSEHPQRRREKVMQAAQVISKVFKDENPISIKGYCRMIWRGLNGEMQQRPALQGLLDAIDRTLTFWRESRNDKRPLAKPGAYLRSILKESGWLEREYQGA